MLLHCLEKAPAGNWIDQGVPKVARVLGMLGSWAHGPSAFARWAQTLRAPPVARLAAPLAIERRKKMTWSLQVVAPKENLTEYMRGGDGLG